LVGKSAIVKPIPFSSENCSLHLASDEAVEAFEAADAKRLLLTHRPHERPLDSSLEQAYDGMELEV